jgi:RNA polymerase sigma-70 factor (ECF subfamily)
MDSHEPNRGELEDLMARYASGDQSAFRDLYRQASPGLHSAVRRWTRDPAQAEDVVQTTFLKLVRARSSYQLGEPVLPWLHVIAKRTLMDDNRPLRRRQEVLTPSGMLPSAAATGENHALEVEDALGKLPAPYRDAIALTKLFGFSGSEAAWLLDTTKAAIKQRVHRGYALLRAWFEGNLTTPPAATA